MLQKHFYTKVNLLLPFILFVSLLFLSGCQERDSIDDVTPVSFQEDSTLMETFTLINMQEKTHKLTLSPKKLTFHDVDQPVIIIHIFKTFDTETSYLLKTLTALQKNKPEDLFVVSLQVGDTINTKSLQTFIKTHQLIHFISNDIENHHFQTILYESLSLSQKTALPLTVIYSDGEYVIHYEGAMPREMLSHNIQQALQN
jgi:hypothetical protein